MAHKLLKSLSDLYEKLKPSGLVTPQCVDLEEATLGAAMVDKSSATRMVSVIGPRSLEDSPFYRDAHTLIYLAALALYEKGEPIDLLTVKNQLSTDGNLEKVGGAAYLVDLTSRIVTTVNVESYCRIILEKYISRELIGICEEIKLRTFEGEHDSFELLDTATDQFLRLSSLRSARSRPIKVGERVKAVLDQIESTRKQDGVPGIATGYSDWDHHSQGLGRGTQIILAADTGAGKSALSANIAHNVAYRGEGVVIFSHEMKDLEIYLRMLSRVTGIDHDDLKSGLRRDSPAREDELWREATKGMFQLGQLPLWIDDTAGLTPVQIRARLRQVSARNSIGLVVVDYLQLLKPSHKEENQNLKIASISAELNVMWKDFNCAGLVLSQMSREGKKAKRRPELWDLRDSGSIEQDAHDVYFLWNPDDQDIAKDMVELELIRRKARGGKIGTMKVWFNKRLQEFTEYQPGASLPTFDGPPGEPSF